MASVCWGSIEGEAMRLTRVDSCGRPIVGAASTIVSDGFISVGLTFEYEDGEETNQKNAAGRLCKVWKQRDQFKYVTAEISLCGVEPDLHEMTTGNDSVLDANGASVGITVGEDPDDAYFALEVWSNIPDAECGVGAQPYGYFLLPFFSAARVGDLTLEATLANFSLTATTKRSNGWGVGPYMVVNSAEDGEPSVPSKLLTPLSSKKHFLATMTTIAPPTIPAECGAVALAA